MFPSRHLLLLASCWAAVVARPFDSARPVLRAQLQPLQPQTLPPLALSTPTVLSLRGGSSGSDFGALSLLPPVVALVASVALKQVIVALLLGVSSGVLLLQRGNVLRALAQTFDTYMVDALADRSHAGVLIFTLLLGGTIGLVQKAGGGLALGALLQRFMSSAQKGLVCAWALSGLIFFDDYSSILIVGNSLRPVMEPLSVAPERFAFIVHVMGVCLASISPISSWAGLQIGYVADAFKQLGIEASLTRVSHKYHLTSTTSQVPPHKHHHTSTTPPFFPWCHTMCHNPISPPWNHTPPFFGQLLRARRTLSWQRWRRSRTVSSRCSCSFWYHSSSPRVKTSDRWQP